MPNVEKLKYTWINVGCQSTNAEASSISYPSMLSVQKYMCFKGWCGGVNNNPCKSNIFSIGSLHNSVLPSTPQSLYRIPALVEGSLYTIELGKKVGRILQPVAQGPSSSSSSFSSSGTPLLVSPFIARCAPRQMTRETSSSEMWNYGREVTEQFSLTMATSRHCENSLA
jgi:hypothetical protein